MVLAARITDLEAQLTAEKAEAAKLREALEKETALSNCLASALEYIYIDDYSLSYPDLGVISGVATPALEAHYEARQALAGKEGQK